MWVMVKVKFFLSHLAHRVGRSPAIAAGTWIWGQCVAWCACLPPSVSILVTDVHSTCVNDLLRVALECGVAIGLNPQSEVASLTSLTC